MVLKNVESGVVAVLNRWQRRQLVNLGHQVRIVHLKVWVLHRYVDNVE